MAEKIKIIVVDDHTIVRQGVSQALQKKENFEVVGEAESGQTAIDLVSELCPDVIIMDINMPGLNGIQTTKQILQINSDIKVLALSMHSEKVYVMGMLNSGASAYLLKTCSIKELYNAINIVLSGKIYLCPDIKSQIVDESLDSNHGEKRTLLSILTQREREVLKLIAEGYLTKSIAHQLTISTKTVDVHRANLKKKLGIHGTAQLTKFAITHEITSIDL